MENVDRNVSDPYDYLDADYQAWLEKYHPPNEK